VKGQVTGGPSNRQVRTKVNCGKAVRSESSFIQM